jgi:hypothetical protein
LISYLPSEETLADEALGFSGVVDGGASFGCAGVSAWEVLPGFFA